MKIIYIFLLGIVCFSCYSIGNYKLTGVLPENSKVTEVYLLTQEGKGADTLARGQVKPDGSFTLMGKSENRLLYLSVGKRGGRIYFYPEAGNYQLDKMGDDYQIVTDRNGIQSRLNGHLQKVKKNSDARVNLQQQMRQKKRWGMGLFQR